MEQAIIRGGASLLKELGPYGFGALLIVSYILKETGLLGKKNDKNEVDKRDIDKRINDLNVEMEKKVAYVDLKEYQRVEVAKSEMKSIDTQLRDIKAGIDDVKRRLP